MPDIIIQHFIATELIITLQIWYSTTDWKLQLELV